VVLSLLALPHWHRDLETCCIASICIDGVELVRDAAKVFRRSEHFLRAVLAVDTSCRYVVAL
jgi:hypothetical protein